MREQVRMLNIDAQPRLHAKRPCAVCGGTPTRFVRERIPGSKGRMAQSFASSYRLCNPCIALATRNGAVDGIEEKTGGREERITVLGKTYAWLKQLVGEKREKEPES